MALISEGNPKRVAHLLRKMTLSDINVKFVTAIALNKRNSESPSNISTMYSTKCVSGKATPHPLLYSLSKIPCVHYVAFSRQIFMPNNRNPSRLA